MLNSRTILWHEEARKVLDLTVTEPKIHSPLRLSVPEQSWRWPNVRGDFSSCFCRTEEKCKHPYETKNRPSCCVFMNSCLYDLWSAVYICLGRKSSSCFTTMTRIPAGQDTRVQFELRMGIKPQTGKTQETEFRWCESLKMEEISRRRENDEFSVWWVKNMFTEWIPPSVDSTQNLNFSHEARARWSLKKKLNI